MNALLEQELYKTYLSDLHTKYVYISNSWTEKDREGVLYKILVELDCNGHLKEKYRIQLVNNYDFVFKKGIYKIVYDSAQIKEYEPIPLIEITFFQ